MQETQRCFKLHSAYQPTGDQPQAIEALVQGFKEGNQFYGGDGFIKKGVENTIKAVGKIARVGMCETDKEIIHIMLDE